MLFPLFVIGCFWWWAVVLVISIAIIWTLEHERGAGACVLVIAFVALTLATGTSEAIPGWVPNTLPEIILTVLAYIGIGTCWGFAKWYLYAVDRLRQYTALRREWLDAKGLDDGTVPPELRDEWLECLAKHSGGWVRYKYDNDGKRIYVLTVKPLAKQNKGRIATWMTYWPWSLLWTLCADLIKRVFKKIQELCSNAMDKIAHWVFRNFEED